MTVDERAAAIYGYLRAHPGRKVSRAALLAATGLQPGTKTDTAIRRARDLATADGLHFPPAVPANGFTYTVTRVRDEAVEPMVHMVKIAAGVARRAGDGAEFIATAIESLDEPTRALAEVLIPMQRAMQAQAEVAVTVANRIALARREAQAAADGQR
jgi:hypothetical protein